MPVAAAAPFYDASIRDGHRDEARRDVRSLHISGAKLGISWLSFLQISRESEKKTF